MRRCYYDRGNVTTSLTSLQFFANTYAGHTNGKSGTNMPLEAKLPNEFRVDHVGVRFPIHQVTAGDAAAADEAVDWLEILAGAFIDIDVQGGADVILPVAACLMSNRMYFQSFHATTAVTNTTQTESDGVHDPAQPMGGNFEFTIPANTIFTVMLGLESTLPVEKATTTIYLYGDEQVRE